MELCKGNSLCNNKNDLQWCKNDTSWNQTIPFDWKPIYQHFICTPKPQQDVIDFHGQWMKETKRGDENYHCLNRDDENPFVRNTTSTGKSWLEWITTPCFDKESTRCLGGRPDQCVSAFSKFYLDIGSIHI